MTREESFVASLISDYAKAGWNSVDPSESGRELGFAPDVLLQRGSEHLVIDVKPQGYRESSALGIIRKLVQSQDGWRFEIKVIPPSWGLDAAGRVPDNIDRRIELSERLLEDGNNQESFILAWTALEASLRRRTPVNANSNGEPPYRLMREAFESGVISEDQLRSLEIDLQTRNRLMHGISCELSKERVSELLKLIRSVAFADAA